MTVSPRIRSSSFQPVYSSACSSVLVGPIASVGVCTRWEAYRLCTADRWSTPSEACSWHALGSGSSPRTRIRTCVRWTGPGSTGPDSNLRTDRVACSSRTYWSGSLLDSCSTENADGSFHYPKSGIQKAKKYTHSHNHSVGGDDEQGHPVNGIMSVYFLRAPYFSHSYNIERNC